MKNEIKKAMEFAQKAHMAQSYDQWPYFKHLEDVYNVILLINIVKKHTSPLTCINQKIRKSLSTN
jgi:hypothetical protein